MTISTIPDFPAIGDATFNAKSYAWATHIAGTFKTEANALQTDVNAKQVLADSSKVAAALSETNAAASAAAAAAYGNATGTSTTSMAISVATGKAFTTQSGKTWVAGMPVIAYNSAGNYMICTVASYASTTLTLDCIAIVGTGTFAVWSLYANMNLDKGCIHVQDQKASGTAAGSTTGAGSYTRTLNTVVTNTITGASLATDLITLPAGTYDFQASAPHGTSSGNGVLVLYNNTDAANITIGTVPSAGFERGWVMGRFTLAAPKNVKLVHYVAGTQATNGLGQAMTKGFVEVYAEIKINKVA